MNKKLAQLAKNPWSIFRFLNHRHMLDFLSDEMHEKVMYRAYIGKKLELKHPVTYNEKIQWIKLYDRKPEYTRNADKYAVREYIREVMGEEYLVPLFGVYTDAAQIDWDALPDSFVLKCTHGSGTNVICRDKSKLDIPETVRKLNMWLKMKPFLYGREWCYKNIEPRIICEQIIQTEDGAAPNDYKFMCFNGEPELIQVHRHRGQPDYSLSYYTSDWKKTDIKRIDAPTTSKEVDRPEHLEQMLDFARLLAKGTYFARVDFYYENNRILFGEITYYPTSGYSTFEDMSIDTYLGSLISLPTDKE